MADKTYPDGSPIQEYPKLIYKEDGSKVIVENKAEEAEHTGKVEPEPSKSEEDKKGSKKSNEPAWKTN